MFTHQGSFVFALTGYSKAASQVSLSCILPSTISMHDPHNILYLSLSFFSLALFSCRMQITITSSLVGLPRVSYLTWYLWCPTWLLLFSSVLFSFSNEGTEHFSNSCLTHRDYFCLFCSLIMTTTCAHIGNLKIKVEWTLITAHVCKLRCGAWTIKHVHSNIACRISRWHGCWQSCNCPCGLLVLNVSCEIIHHKYAESVYVCMV